MLADKITKYLEGEHHYSSDVLQSSCEQFGGSLARQLMGESQYEPRLRMSNLGSCPRKVWLQIAGEKGEPINARTRMNFSFGDYVEVATVAIIRLMAEKEEYGIKIYEELVQGELEWEGIKGHADLPCSIDGQDVVVEVKSMSNYGFREFCKNGPGDMWGYPAQLQAYLRATGFDTGLWLGVRKETGHYAEYVELRDDDRYANDAYVVMAQINSPTKPSRPMWAVLTGEQEIKDVRCQYCDMKRPCWGPMTVEVIKNKPHYKVG